MLRLTLLLMVLTVFCVPSLRAQNVKVEPENSHPRKTAVRPWTVSHTPKSMVMSEYRGLSLGMTPDEVRSTLARPPTESGRDRLEFRFDQGDKLKVGFSNGVVESLEIYFSDPSDAPPFSLVTGEAEIRTLYNGARFAEFVAPEERLMVSMYQSRGGAVTMITIRRQARF